MVDVTRSLHRKLAQVMYEAERIPKNGVAPKEMGGYRFVEVGDAADFIRKALAEKVITMMPTAVHVAGYHEGTTKSGAAITTVDLVTEWTLTDGESGESITIMSFGAGSDMGDKYSGKASTSAMKYALLTGFLLSTGDDTERSNLPERRPPSEPRPELDRPVSDLIGTVEVGKPPVDMQLREDREAGPIYGFKLKNGTKAFQVLATGDLAAALSTVGLETGTRVTVEGSMVMVPWEKGGVAMPPFSRVMLTRVRTGDWTLPALEAESVPMFDDDEAAAIVAAEIAEAAG